MLERAILETIVARANLAPSVHNTQPARWRQKDDVIEVAADWSVVLPVSDPEGRDAGLSCGAAVEATSLALGDEGYAAMVSDLWAKNDTATWPGHRLAARIAVTTGEADPLAAQLARRFTWRGAFGAVPEPFPNRGDTAVLTDANAIAAMAKLNDDTSLQIMRQRGFRRELLAWMRLTDAHPRARFDGLARVALRMPKIQAWLAGFALGPLWPLLDRVGLTGTLTSEGEMTCTAPVLACFHRPQGESPVTSGRAYLRMWLAATAAGYAGWPMAALTDDPAARAQVCRSFALSQDRMPLQVLRFGAATGPRPPVARRPIEEILR